MTYLSALLMPIFCHFQDFHVTLRQKHRKSQRGNCILRKADLIKLTETIKKHHLVIKLDLQCFLKVLEGNLYHQAQLIKGFGDPP